MTNVQANDNQHTQALEHRLALLNQVHKLGQDITESLDVETQVALCTRRVLQMLNAYVVTVGTVDADTLVVEATARPDGQLVRMPTVRLALKPPGLLIKAIMERQTLNTADVSTSPDYVPDPQFSATRAELTVPLIYRDEVVGVIDVQRTDNPFADDDVYAIEALAPTLAAALMNARLFATERARSEHLRLVNEVTSDMTRILGLHSLVNAVARRVAEALPRCDFASVALIQDEELLLIPGDAPPDPPEAAADYPRRLPIDTSSRLGLAARYEWPVIVHDVDTEPGGGGLPRLPLTRSAMAVPLRSRGRVVGIIDVQSNTRRAFVRQDIELVEALCGQLGVVIENVSLFESLKSQRRKLDKRNQELEQLHRLKDDLTAMIVHDLRTPLNALHLALESAVRSEDMARRQRVTDLALISVTRMATLIDNMLDVARMETNSLELAITATDVAEMLRSASQLLHLEAEIDGKHIQVDVDPQLPVVEIDRGLLERVVLNLMSNALKYSPAGRAVHVSAHLNGSNLRVSVRDEGDGIPPEYLDSVFEKYVRVIDDQGRRRTGVGLGLTFCRLAVERHGGRIAVDSTVGKGSDFWFELPVISPASPMPAPAGTSGLKA